MAAVPDDGNAWTFRGEAGVQFTCSKQMALHPCRINTFEIPASH